MPPLIATVAIPLTVAISSLLTQSATDPAAIERQTAALVEKQPTAANWQKLGLARYLQNRYPEAIAALRSSIQLDGRVWTAHLFLGICLYRTNQFAESLATLERARRFAPAAAAGRDDLDYWLGAARIANRQPLAGLRSLETLLARNPQHVDALQLATETYTDLASGLWSRVAERAFESAPGQEVHGHALESDGNREGALAAFERSASVAPARPGPLAQAARLYLTAGNLDAARSALDRELRNDPVSGEANLLAGMLAMRTGQPAQAIEPLLRAAQWQPRNDEAHLALCQAYLATGASRNAADAARRAVELDPLSVAAHELLLAAVTALGDEAGATAERLRWQRQASPR